MKKILLLSLLLILLLKPNFIYADGHEESGEFDPAWFKKMNWGPYFEYTFQVDGDYKPGDIVAWDLGGGLTHIGIVIDRLSNYSNKYLIVHNIGRGQVAEDILFDNKIIGHYRFKE